MKNNMYFPEEYFNTETRDGFTINELMKRAWAAQLVVLQKIIDICEKYDLTYYAYWGTLLGAVRHQGYIPWDDDLDIAMKRDDYIKFLEVAKEELPQEYCILNAYTEKEYDDIFTRVTNRHSIDFSPEALEEYHGCPFVVGVDIFPLYYLTDNEEEASVQRKVLELIIAVSEMEDARILALKNEKYELVKEYQKEVVGGLVELQNITSYQFTTERPIKNQLLILYDQMSRLFLEEESFALTSFPQYLRKGYYVERELLEESIKMPFENIYVNVPKRYDAILGRTYRDYMVPRRVRAAHDYPFYKGQLESLGRFIEKKNLEGMMRQQKNTHMIFDEVSECMIPEEWYKKIQNSGDEKKRKKVILYYASADSLICHEELVTAKLKYIFRVFKENKEVVLWWIPYLLNDEKLRFLERMTPELVDTYKELMEVYQEEGWGIYDDSGDVDRAIAIADAYYGDLCGLSERFQNSIDKAIMLQDYKYC